MIKRIITGILVGAAWLAGLCFLPGWGLFAVLLIMSTICQREFYGMLKQADYPAAPNSGVVMGVIWLLFCFVVPPLASHKVPLGSQLEMLLLLLMIFALLLRVLFDAHLKRPIILTSITLLGFFYLPFMLSYFVRLSQWGATELCQVPNHRGGIFLAAYLAGVVKFSDVGAYGFGINFGRHKLFPRVSPKKSWEGLIGGLVVGMLFSVLLVAMSQRCAWVPPNPLQTFSWGHAALLGLILSLTGALGDLIESLFKRSTNIKDSAALLPGGGGGILDMFDSLIFTPAILYYYLSWVAA